MPMLVVIFYDNLKKARLLFCLLNLYSEVSGFKGKKLTKRFILVFATAINKYFKVVFCRKKPNHTNSTVISTFWNVSIVWTISVSRTFWLQAHWKITENAVWHLRPIFNTSFKKQNRRHIDQSNHNVSQKLQKNIHYIIDYMGTSFFIFVETQR